MTVALRSPELVSALIPVDNAPVNAALKSDFPKYVRGMQHVESAKVSKQSDADKILKDYEEVRSPPTAHQEYGPFLVYSVRELTCPVSSNPPIPSHQPRPRRGPGVQVPVSSLGARRVPRPHGGLPLQRIGWCHIRRADPFRSRHQVEIRI